MCISYRFACWSSFRFASLRLPCLRLAPLSFALLCIALLRFSSLRSASLRLASLDGFARLCCLAGLGGWPVVFLVFQQSELLPFFGPLGSLEVSSLVLVVCSCALFCLRRALETLVWWTAPLRAIAALLEAGWTAPGAGVSPLSPVLKLKFYLFTLGGGSCLDSIQSLLPVSTVWSVLSSLDHTYTA